MTNQNQSDGAVSTAASETMSTSSDFSQTPDKGMAEHIITEGAVLGFGGFIPFGGLSILLALPAMLLPGMLGQSHLMANPGVGLGIILLSLMTTSLFTAFILSGYAEIADGQKDMSWGAAMTRAVDVFWPVLALLILKLLAFAIGGLLLVVPAFLVWGLLSLSCSFLVLENLDMRSALQASVNVTKNDRWKLAGIQIIKLFILLIPALIISNIFGAIFADYDAIEKAREAGLDPPQPWQGFLMLFQVYLIFSAAFEIVTYRWLKNKT